jgi:hypothetical protein
MLPPPSCLCRCSLATECFGCDLLTLSVFHTIETDRFNLVTSKWRAILDIE